MIVLVETNKEFVVSKDDVLTFVIRPNISTDIIGIIVEDP